VVPVSFPYKAGISLSFKAITHQVENAANQKYYRNKADKGD